MTSTTKESPVLEQIVDVKEAASMLGVSKAAVVRAIQYGRIEAKLVGRSWAVLKSSVLRYEVEEHRVRAGKSSKRTGVAVDSMEWLALSRTK
ncbi:MAG: helix-turn-helix domain-containing protein [Myxococcota bacterium]